MRFPSGHTPKEFAVDRALHGLRVSYDNLNGALDDMTPAQQREAKRAIAKLHNKLLDKSRLDGIGLDDEGK